ncbi:hypothetical protein ACI6Q2_22510 [Chitinophagaceae bacterium LWZ2-11]
MYKAIDKKYDKLSEALVKNSERALKRMQRKEAKLKKKLAGKDSVLAKQISSESVNQTYAGLTNKLQSDVDLTKKAKVTAYIPQVDSTQTMLTFLSNRQNSLPGAGTNQLAQLAQASTSVATLQQRLQQAEDVKQYLKERKEQLKQLLQQSPVGQELQSINKEVYYYQAQLNEYKAALSDPDKLTEKALQILQQQPAFTSFMQQNSILSQLFPMPQNYGTPQALAGLQTRAAVQQQLNGVLNMGGGGGGTNHGQYLQQQTQAAQTQLSTLKDKVNQLGGGGSGIDIPDFKPNGQKTKSFLQRLEYGVNIQSQKTTYLLPSTTDIAATVGYKLNDKSTIGVGASYKLGWGKPFNDIHLSNQGMGIRSFIDVKIKGSIWMSGGYELNYQSAYVNLLPQSFGSVAWQKSGLVGLTKKYKVGKKTCNMQLLWDFLSYSQIPKTQALKFRVGYTF